jgi:uncharacterized protein YneF (UPF0154 family)
MMEATDMAVGAYILIGLCICGFFICGRFLYKSFNREFMENSREAQERIESARKSIEELHSSLDATPTEEFDRLTKAKLRIIAEKRGVKTNTRMTKAQILVLLRQK